MVHNVVPVYVLEPVYITYLLVTCRCRAEEADALNAPLFTLIKTILETVD